MPFSRAIKKRRRKSWSSCSEREIINW